MTGADDSAWIADYMYVGESGDCESGDASSVYALEWAVSSVEASEVDLYGAAYASD